MIAILCILTPLLAAMGRLFIPSRSKAIIATSASTILTLIFALLVSGSQIQYEVLPSIGLNFALNGSNTSSILIICTALIMIPTALYIVKRITKHTNRLLCLVLVMQAGLNGIFLADNLVLLYIFCGVTFIAALLIWVGWGKNQARQTRQTYLMYALVGSLLILIGILAVLL